jgi:DNA-binding FrmR family transcriptional regulator
MLGVVARKNQPCHDPVDHGRQIPRLRRIEGQVRGLQQMITEARSCVEVINQIDAVAAGLRRIQADMLSDHITAVSRTAMTGGLSAADCELMATEVADLLKRRR